MTPHDLVAAAQDLVGDGKGAPRQANLRRAISTAYYDLFHCLAECCADALAAQCPDRDVGAHFEGGEALALRVVVDARVLPAVA